MPNTKSAIKAMRQAQKRRGRNVVRARAYKTAIKDFHKAAATSPKDAAAMLPLVQKKLDKAAKTGVIKKNKAARLKGNATRFLAKSAK